MEKSASSLKMHTFSEELSSVNVSFEVLKLENSLFIWIGDENRSFSDMSVIMNLPPNEVTTSRLLGSVHMTTSSDLMGKRISLKLEKPVYLSYNLPMEDNILMKAVEKKIQSEITSNPDNF
jgi:hypothetical protein